MIEDRVLRVPAMSCAHCETSVREALDGLEGVDAVRADHKTGEVELTYDEDKVRDRDLRKAIEEAGYTLRG
jgi:copper chaperone